MAIFNLVPFLLALPYNVHHYMKETSYTSFSVFDIQVKSLFVPDWKDVDIRMPNVKMNSLSLLLSCQIVLSDRMLCRITAKHNYSYEENQLSSNNLFLILKKKFINPKSFNHPNLLFEIQFNQSGVNAYFFYKNDKESMKLNNIFRMVGNLLSIGTNSINERDAFHTTMERSTIGYCPTIYKIFRHPLIQEKLMTNLIPLFDLHFNDNEEIFITKYREIHKCVNLSSYMFTMRFWPKFIPMMAASQHIKKSISLLELSKNNLKSTTENSFEFHDVHGYPVGSILETINIQLKSIQMVPLFDYLNGNLSMDVINDDEI